MAKRADARRAEDGRGRGKPRLRCAIYTRKSTEEGLEQDFNSLAAQREACAAFVASQVGEGWLALPTIYDDGGYSGGSMGRPALTRLLADVEAGRVDVVVVYKVDRLTRSLTDFARIVERFDARGVSFVSVTQAFNTTTSMGRLTLNVLLSFAQFEREVTAERIRDKIAASKRKGMWMGGPVPLGYDASVRRLVVNPAEAEIVRRLFRLYLEAGSLRSTKEMADELGLRTKPRVRRGEARGDSSFSVGHLRQLLTNPVYIGKTRHRGAIFDGAHEAIVSEDLFAAVQAQLAAGAPERRAQTNSRAPHRLAGLLFDEAGDRLTPVHANKGGRRYHYYVSHRLLQRRRMGSDDGWRVPAHVLDDAIIAQLRSVLTDPHRLLELLPLKEIADARSTIAGAAHFAQQLEQAEPEQAQALLRALVHRIDLGRDQLTIKMWRPALLPFRPDEVPLVPARDGSSCPAARSEPSDDEPLDDVVVLAMALEMKRRGREDGAVAGRHHPSRSGSLARRAFAQRA